MTEDYREQMQIQREQHLACRQERLLAEQLLNSKLDALTAAIDKICGRLDNGLSEMIRANHAVSQRFKLYEKTIVGAVGLALLTAIIKGHIQ